MSNAFDQQNDPTPYINSVPGLSKADPPPAQPSYTEQRLDLAKKESDVDDKTIASLESARDRRRALEGRRTPLPADPKLTNIPDAPKFDYSDPIKAFQNPAVIIATLGSLFSRAPMTAALNAGAAAMTAYHKGEAEVFAEKREEWKQAAEKAREQNQKELELYNAQWKKHDAAVSDKMAQMQAIAASVKDEVMIAGIKTGQLDRIDKILEAREKANDKLKEIDKRFKTSGGTFDQQTMDIMADQYLAGDKSVFQNLGRGIQGSANIQALRQTVANKMREYGISGAEQATKIAEMAGLTAGERTLGTRTANIEMAVNEAYNMLPLALSASENVPRGKWTDLNKLIQAGATHSSDPAMANFLAAHNAVINTYARAISPSGVPTVTDKEHAREIFTTATGPAAYKAVLDQIAREMEAARRSPGQVREEFRRGHTGATAPPPPTVSTKANDGWKIERLDQ
jgi:hypothetical protein